MLSDTLKMHGGDIQVLSGHVHRNATGQWCGYGFSTLKSLFAQFDADMVSKTLQRSTEAPGYGVILLDQEQLVLNFIDLTQEV